MERSSGKCRLRTARPPARSSRLFLERLRPGRRALGIAAAFLLWSCAREPVTNFTVGQWVPIHEKNPDLVGVYVQQFPDCDGDGEAKLYEGKHPCMIIYVFKNRRAHQLGYWPDGRIRSGFWWSVAEDHSIWSRLEKVPPEGR